VIVVFDANVLVGCLIALQGGTLAQILAAWRAGQFEIVLSEHIYGELARALASGYFTRRLAATTIAGYLGFVAENARVVPISVAVSGVATHPEDDLVLATALSAGADFLVTGDIKFRSHVPAFGGVRRSQPG